MENFLRKIKTQNYSIIPIIVETIPVWYYRKKEKTKNFNLCSFNCDNPFSSTERWTCIAGNVNGCCNNCYNQAGYFMYNDVIERKTLRLMNKLFKKPHKNGQGFLRFDSGCVLPRKYRSKICLTYVCTTICKNVTSTQKAILEQIHSYQP